MPWLVFLIALIAGAASPVQAGANAQLNKQLQQPVLAGVFVYATGFAALLIFLLAQHHSLPPQSRFATVNWWAWLGGLISIISTMAGLTLAQKMGSGLFTGCSLTASLITSVVLDQFGLIGFDNTRLRRADWRDAAFLQRVFGWSFALEWKLRGNVERSEGPGGGLHPLASIENCLS